MIDPMKGKQTLKSAELQDGDIVCFQLPEKADFKSSDPVLESAKHLPNLPNIANANRSESMDTSSLRSNMDRIEDARVFYDFLYYKQKVEFGPHPVRNANAEALPQFSLLLNKKYTYDQVVARIADKLSVDPTHLRLWTVNSSTNSPKSAVKRTASQNLSVMLSPTYSAYSNTQRGDALFYEILEISLSELDTKKVMKVLWVSEGTSKEVSHVFV